MEHKTDEFFRKKIESIEDKIPESSNFDEQFFWGELQKNLNKPKTIGWWKWLAVAACLGGLALWSVSISKVVPETPKTVYTQRVEPSKEKSIPVASRIVPQKTRVKIPKLKKKEAIKPIEGPEMKIEQLAIKVNPIPTQALALKKDSIYFKPATMAELKPQFKTIHANEISNTEKSPIPQARFKIRFAARNQQ